MDHGTAFRVQWCKCSKEMWTKEMDRLLTLDLKELENARWNMTLRWVRNHVDNVCKHSAPCPGVILKPADSIAEPFAQ